MNIHHHAPPGAPAAQTAVARLLDADWSKGIPPGYRAVLERLKQLRGEYEEQIAAAIDGLDILDMAIADLEPEEDANEEDQGGEPSLGAPEAVTCGDGPAEPFRKVRRIRSRKALAGNGETVAEGGKSARGLTLSIDRSCDQERWAQGTSDAYTGLDAELDTADDEPSYGSIGSSGFISQSQWAEGGDQDEREDENEHGSDEDRGEAELGATTAMNHDHAWAPPGGKLWGFTDGEPSLGWTGVGHGHPETAMRGYDDDREDEHDGREDGHDAEQVNEDGGGEYEGSGCWDGTRPPSFMDAAKPNLGQPFLNPEALPERYAMGVSGNCMSPIYSDGDTLVFNSRKAFTSGDIVAIHLVPAFVRPGQFQVMVKRYIGHGGPAGRGILVEYDFPTRTPLAIPIEQVLAIHCCEGRLPDDVPRVRCVPAPAMTLSGPSASDWIPVRMSVS